METFMYHLPLYLHIPLNKRNERVQMLDTTSASPMNYRSVTQTATRQPFPCGLLNHLHYFLLPRARLLIVEVSRNTCIIICNRSIAV